MDEVISPIKKISKEVKEEPVSEVKEELVEEVKEVEVKEEEQEYVWTKPTSIDEFEIVDALGDGAYGVVKLAYRKNDPKQEVFKN